MLWAELLEAGLSAGSVRHVRRTLSAALNVAVKRGRLRSNPVSLAPTPADATPEIIPLTVPEAQAVINAARTERDGVRWAIARALGLRQSEILGLQWSDIDLDGVGDRRRQAGRRRSPRPRPPPRAGITLVAGDWSSGRPWPSRAHRPN